MDPVGFEQLFGRRIVAFRLDALDLGQQFPDASRNACASTTT
jgi:hypothetical protein